MTAHDHRPTILITTFSLRTIHMIPSLNQIPSTRPHFNMSHIRTRHLLPRPVRDRMDIPNFAYLLNRPSVTNPRNNHRRRPLIMKMSTHLSTTVNPRIITSRTINITRQKRRIRTYISIPTRFNIRRNTNTNQTNIRNIPVLSPRSPPNNQVRTTLRSLVRTSNSITKILSSTRHITLRGYRTSPNIIIRVPLPTASQLTVSALQVSVSIRPTNRAKRPHQPQSQIKRYMNVRRLKRKPAHSYRHQPQFTSPHRTTPASRTTTRYHTSTLMKIRPIDLTNRGPKERSMRKFAIRRPE